MHHNKDLTITKGTAEEEEFFHSCLAEFNNELVPYAQEKNIIPLNYVIKDHANTVIAGISGVFYNWKILLISHLWVQEDYRYHGLGRKLMHTAEKRTKSFGGTLIHLETYDFQSKKFYLKIGFEVFGILKNCPPGHNKFFLKKEI